jgi:hypothetical protein
MIAAKRLRALLALPLALIMTLTGCDLTSAGVREEIAGVETILALTPSATITPTVTNTPEPTATFTPTVGPSPTASNTPSPTVTPLPPTPTPNPALAGFSFCDQQAGATAGLFSARLAEVTASGTPAYEQVQLRFELGAGSAPLGATAACLGPADSAALAPDRAVSPYAVRVSLPGWIRDERFRASELAETLSFTGTRTITAARIVPAADPEAGADLLIELSEPLPFRLSVERDPTRLVIAVARSSPVVASSDLLRLPAGGARPSLAEPIFTLFDGDVWRVEAGLDDPSAGISPGLAGALNLTESPESETQLAVSSDRAQVAFCRAAPGLDPVDSELPVPSTLWLMDADGQNARPLAQIGVSCADPAFSPDGATLAFAADETGATPIKRAIYTVPVSGGTPQRLGSDSDEWSRFAPQWLSGGALVYAAQAQDGRSTLFFRNDLDQEEEDVGAEVLVRSGGLAPYAALGRPLAAPDGGRFAVEALRSDAAGADLLILDATGALVETLGAQRVLPPPSTPTPTRTATSTSTPTSTRTPVSTDTTAAPTATPEPEATPTVTASPAPTPELAPPPEDTREGPFWTRALAWDGQGRLLYLSTLCASQAVQDYQIARWAGAQRSELLASGQSLGGIGTATMVGDALAYLLTGPPSGPRGPAARTPREPVELWLWNLDTGARGQLLTAERGAGDLAP